MGSSKSSDETFVPRRSAGNCRLASLPANRAHHEHHQRRGQLPKRTRREHRQGRGDRMQRRHRNVVKFGHEPQARRARRRLQRKCRRHSNLLRRKADRSEGRPQLSWGRRALLAQSFHAGIARAPPRLRLLPRLPRRVLRRASLQKEAAVHVAIRCRGHLPAESLCQDSATLRRSDRRASNRSAVCRMEANTKEK